MATNGAFQRVKSKTGSAIRSAILGSMMTMGAATPTSEIETAVQKMEDQIEQQYDNFSQDGTATQAFAKNAKQQAQTLSQASPNEPLAPPPDAPTDPQPDSTQTPESPNIEQTPDTAKPVQSEQELPQQQEDFQPFSETPLPDQTPEGYSQPEEANSEESATQEGANRGTMESQDGGLFGTTRQSKSDRPKDTKQGAQDNNKGSQNVQNQIKKLQEKKQASIQKIQKDTMKKTSGFQQKIQEQKNLKRIKQAEQLKERIALAKEIAIYSTKMFVAAIIALVGLILVIIGVGLAVLAFAGSMAEGAQIHWLNIAHIKMKLANLSKVIKRHEGFIQKLQGHIKRITLQSQQQIQKVSRPFDQKIRQLQSQIAQ